MKTRILIITLFVIAVFLQPLWNEQAFALCVADVNYDSVLKESELVFTGTVTRLDNYDGPQKVAFLVHDVIKGEINTTKYILENSELQFLEYGVVMGSSVDVDYKIGQSYKVYVENGKTNRCTTKIIAPPDGYIWEPGPEDRNYYSDEYEKPLRQYQDANKRESYRDALDDGSLVLPVESPNLTDTELDAAMDGLYGHGLDHTELPIASIAIDYKRDILVLWTPDLTLGNKIQELIGDMPFVLLYEESPARWEHDGPSPEPVPWSISPLKQFKSGIAIDDIQCKKNMVLLKKHDGSPACVKPDSVIDLIKRNWLVTDEISGYAIDYDGDVKHLPFADICTNEMKIILLTYSNIASPDEQFVMEYVTLPSRMNQEDFQRCADETSFTKSRWNMVTMDNPEPKSSFTQRYHVSLFQNSKTMKPYVTPDFITIGPGEKVTWSNYDKTPHTIFSNDSVPPWSTGKILPDGYATIMFNKTGIYEYRGNPGTHGFIVVMDDDGQLLESRFSTVFGHSSPLVYNEGLKPVLLYDNCERYVYWLNEHGKEKITLPEDYPRYPPWGNQIFPLVEFCTSNGEIVNTGDGNSVHWEFKVENEN